MKLAALIAVCTGLIVIVWVALTPLEPLPTEPPRNVTQPFVEERVHTAASDSAVSLRKNEFHLPQEDTSLSVDQLKQEMTEVVESLQMRYPTLAEAHHIVALMHVELKQFQQAETAWKKCLELNATEPGPFVGLASIYTDRGEEQAAIDLLEKFVMTGKPNGEVYHEWARALSTRGELERADAIIDVGLERFPTDKSLWLQRGLVHTQLRRFESAEDAIRKAIQYGDRNDATLNAMMVVLARTGKKEEANQIREAIENLAKNKPASGTDSFQADYMRSLREIGSRLIRYAAMATMNQGDLKQAETWLMRSVAIAPMDFENYMAISALFRKQHRFYDALSVQKVLLQKQPTNVYNYINLASVATSLGDLKLAERVLVDATLNCPDEPFPYGELARICLARRDFSSVRRWSEQARRLEPKNVEWYLMPAIAARELGNAQEYEVLVKQAVALAPDDPRLQGFPLPTNNTSP
jgi:Flp pilus assembly protein TadD